MFLVIMIMVGILAIALGVSTILVGQLKMIKGIGDSVVAFYAADTGIERGLYEETNSYGYLENGATYNVQILPPGLECGSPYYCLKSVGTYKDARRAIEVGR